MLSALGAESFNFDNFRYLVAGLALGFAAWVAVRGLRRAGWPLAHRLIGFAGPAFAVGVALRIGDWRAIVPWLGVLAAYACVGIRRPPRGGAAVVIGVIAAVFLGVQRGASQVLPLALIPLAAWLLADVAFRWPAPVLDLLVLISTFGLYLALPDTEESLLLAGVTLASLLASTLTGESRRGATVVAVAAAMFLWVVTVDGFTVRDGNSCVTVTP